MRIILALAIGLWSFSGRGQGTIRLGSTAFDDGKPIPVKYTCDGEDVSPPLQWEGQIADAEEAVIIVDDPDAPTAEPFVHWVAYHIPIRWKGLPEGISRNHGGKFVEGKNDFGRTGWNGPCPPRKDGYHRYYFKIYAVKKLPRLIPGLSKKQVMEAIAPYIVGEATLIGTYDR